MKKIKNERKRNWGLWATEQRSTTSAGKNRDAKVDPRIPTGVSKYTLFVSFSARYMTLCNLDAGGTRWRCHHINVKKLSSLCVSRAAPALELFSFFSVSGNWLLPWIRPHLLSFLLQPPSKHVHAEAAGVAALQTLRSPALVLSLNAPLKPQRLRPLMPHPRRQIKLFGTPACTCDLSFGTLCFSLCLGPLLWCVNLLGQHIIIQFSRKKKRWFIVCKIKCSLGAAGKESCLPDLQWPKLLNTSCRSDKHFCSATLKKISNALWALHLSAACP